MLSVACRFEIEPYNKDNVETTDSLAKKPVIRAVTLCQLPKPHGLNNGANIPAIFASIDSSGLVTIVRPNENLCKNHIMIVARKIIVKALCKKSLAFSHNKCPTFFGFGSR